MADLAHRLSSFVPSFQLGTGTWKMHHATLVHAHVVRRFNEFDQRDDQTSGPRFQNRWIISFFCASLTVSFPDFSSNLVAQRPIPLVRLLLGIRKAVAELLLQPRTSSESALTSPLHARSTTSRFKLSSSPDTAEAGDANPPLALTHDLGELALDSRGHVRRLALHLELALQRAKLNSPRSKEGRRGPPKAGSGRPGIANGRAL